MELKQSMQSVDQIQPATTQEKKSEPVMNKGEPMMNEAEPVMNRREDESHPERSLDQQEIAEQLPLLTEASTIQEERRWISQERARLQEERAQALKERERLLEAREALLQEREQFSRAQAQASRIELDRGAQRSAQDRLEEAEINACLVGDDAHADEGWRTHEEGATPGREEAAHAAIYEEIEAQLQELRARCTAGDLSLAGTEAALDALEVTQRWLFEQLEGEGALSSSPLEGERWDGLLKKLGAPVMLASSLDQIEEKVHGRQARLGQDPLEAWDECYDYFESIRAYLLGLSRLQQAIEADPDYLPSLLKALELRAQSSHLRQKDHL